MAASDEPVGVVGLGNMGLAMARTLARAGFAVAGHDARPERRDLLPPDGEPADDLAGLCRGCSMLLLSLPSSGEVEAVVRGPGGFLASARPDTLLIDTSTADPDSTRALAAELAAAGHAMLDAPVSGGPSGAASGQLLVMVGGPAEALERARPVLDALARKVVHVGTAPGAGNLAKLANNLLCAAHLVTTAEAMALAARGGVDPAALLEAVNAGSGRSAVSEVNFPRWVLPDAFDSGFSMALMRKDVALALEVAGRLGLDPALARHVGAIWRDSRARLADTDDFNRIVDSVWPDRPVPSRESAP
ncbi:MAG TPA: NAD(P)-dependent oxidoreductase [Geminicoccaceae bacterium]|nr:NAD(P)-dependent oxidoreductase [Geminicoccaceae bacterium]